MAGGLESDSSYFLWTASDTTMVLLTGTGDTAHVRGLKTGLSYISVRNTRYPDAYAKTIMVLVEDTVKDDVYITVNKSVLQLKPDAGKGETVKATLAGGAVTDPENFVWWADDYNIAHIDSITGSAEITPAGITGVTYVHVKHPKALSTVDILVMVSNYSQFAFGIPSKTINQGAIAFVPLQVPPSTGNSKIEYSTNNDSICQIVGSNSVAMIAGINHGQTTVAARLLVDGSVTATAELAVIVSYVTPNDNIIITPSAIVNMEIGQNITLQASLQGKDITDIDKYDISWSSSDPAILEILSTENNITKGPSAYLTAKSAGEAVITLSHPKCKYETSAEHPNGGLVEEYIWVIIPRQNEIVLTLDQTLIEMYKEDGAVSITADILNGKSSDYNNIAWSAPKVFGQNIISITKTNGKNCNIIPRNVGQTVLRAQLPNGEYADCIVVVRAATMIQFDTGAVHVNPGYSQTIPYTVNPDNAAVQWIASTNSIFLH
jgi:hypothetical protein